MKLLITGLTAVFATLAGSYVAGMLAGSPSGAEKTTEAKVLEFIKLDVLSVPVIRQGRVQGYVLARIAIGVPVEDAKKNRIAISLYSSEGAFRAIYEEGFEFSHLKAADIGRLADRMTKLINDRMRVSVVGVTTIESLNFVPYSEVRKSKLIDQVAR
jgi:hypothetical protein